MDNQFPKFGFPKSLDDFEGKKPRIFVVFDGDPTQNWKVFNTTQEAFEKLCEHFPEQMKAKAAQLKEEKEKAKTEVVINKAPATEKLPIEKKQTVREKVLSYYKSLTEGQKGSYEHYLSLDEVNPVVKGTFQAQSSFLKKEGAI